MESSHSLLRASIGSNGVMESPVNSLGLLYSSRREEESSSSEDDDISSLEDTSSFMCSGDQRNNYDSSSILSTNEDDEDYHIFTDDEDSSSSPVEQLSEAESAALNDDVVSIQTPTTWAKHNQERGRLLAQTLLQQIRPYYHDYYESDEDIKEQRRRPPPPPRKNKNKKRGSTFLGRAVQSLRFHKRKIKSFSPLDKTITPASSAVHTRNNLVDFGAWEERAGVVTSPSNSCSDNSSVVSFKSASSFKSTTSMGSVMSLKQRITTPIKKLFSPTKDCGSEQDETVSSSSVAEDDLADLAIPSDAMQCLETRTSSEDIVLELGLGQEGYRLLSALRGKAGMVDMEEDSSIEDRSIPLIHLMDDIWVPHYEEYVIRAVNAFMHFLFGT